MITATHNGFQRTTSPALVAREAPSESEATLSESHPAIVVLVDPDLGLLGRVQSLVQAQQQVELKVKDPATLRGMCLRRDGGACVVLAGSSFAGIQPALEQLNDADDPLPVIAVADRWATADVVEAVRCGATDVVDAAVGDGELWRAIERALASDRSGRAWHAEVAQCRKGHAALTDSEQQVVDLVLSGLLNKHIATRLGVSLRTVEGRRSRACQKLGAKTMAELIWKVVIARMPTRMQGRTKSNWLLGNKL